LRILDVKREGQGRGQNIEKKSAEGVGKREEKE